MIHLNKLPTELFYLLAPSLTTFKLMSLLVVCPRRISFHQLRGGCYVSKQDRLVGLIQALCVGEIELIKQIPQLPQLLKDLTNLRNFQMCPTIIDFLAAMNCSRSLSQGLV
jgi:hypothetical protein